MGIHSVRPSRVNPKIAVKRVKVSATRVRPMRRQRKARHACQMTNPKKTGSMIKVKMRSPIDSSLKLSSCQSPKTTAGKRKTEASMSVMSPTHGGTRGKREVVVRAGAASHDEPRSDVNRCNAGLNAPRKSTTRACCNSGGSLQERKSARIKRSPCASARFHSRRTYSERTLAGVTTTTTVCASSRARSISSDHSPPGAR